MLSGCEAPSSPCPSESSQKMQNFQILQSQFWVLGTEKTESWGSWVWEEGDRVTWDPTLVLPFIKRQLPSALRTLSVSVFTCAHHSLLLPCVSLALQDTPGSSHTHSGAL